MTDWGRERDKKEKSKAWRPELGRNMTLFIVKGTGEIPDLRDHLCRGAGCRFLKDSSPKSWAVPGSTRELGSQVPASPCSAFVLIRKRHLFLKTLY